jgi:FMN phosphatase YigB (HAD superfamily)
VRLNLKAVLFDLDDTLLENDMAQFGPVFYELFARRFAPVIEPERLIAALSSALQAVLQHDDPNITNEERFWREFPTLARLPIEILRQLVDRFYAEDFQQLQYLVRARPEAHPIVRLAGDRGLRIVLATNPMFPSTAILQRLEWAGLHASDFTRITTLENSHACKPRARYFTEVLHLIGVEPREALMIGDDWRLDIAPAIALDLHAYWLNERGRQQPAQAPRPDAFGAWHEFVDWWQAIESLS